MSTGGQGDLQPSDTPFVVARDITKVYGPTCVLDRVSLSIKRGEIIGLIGANGAGKSTLIKCLSGAVPLSEGSIVVDGKEVSIGSPEAATSCGIAAVPQEVTLIPDLSVGENVLLGRFPSSWGVLPTGRLRKRARELLTSVKLGHVDPAAPISALTPSEKKMVMVAAVLARKPRLLILDEPTAGLPSEESAVLVDLVLELSAAGVAILYVTHRLHEVKAICGRVIALKNGRHSGTLTGEEITRESMLALMGGSAQTEEWVQTDDHHGATATTGEPLINVRGVSGNRVRDINLTARPGEIIGIAGLAGSGRSELLRLLYGLQSLTAGTVEFKGAAYGPSKRTHPRKGMGYVAELRQSNVFHGLDVSRNLTVNSVGAHRRFGIFANRKWELQATEDTRSQMSLKGAADAPIGNLSGGNQQKVLISRWLVRGVDVLLLDEPTAGVDLHARAEIHALLRSLTDSGMTVIFASVETDELAVLSDRVLVMVEGEVRAELRPPFTEQGLVSALFSHRESEQPNADKADAAAGQL